MAAVDPGKLAGTAGKGEISLPDAVINRFLAEELGRSSGPLAGASIETLDDDVVGIRIELRGPRLIPMPRIVARIDRQPRLPHSAVLGLEWSVPGLGKVGLVASPILTHLNALPEGLRAEGDRLFIDIASLAARHGCGEWFAHARRIEVHSRRGVVLLQAEFRIT